MKHLAGLYMVIPVAELLVVSFFVLFAMRRTDSQGLKRFGYVVCILLWASAALLSAKGAFLLAKKNCPTICRILKIKECPLMKGAKCDKMKAAAEHKTPEMKKGCGK
jgi:hypothetical protein